MSLGLRVESLTTETLNLHDLFTKYVGKGHIYVGKGSKMTLFKPFWGRFVEIDWLHRASFDKWNRSVSSMPICKPRTWFKLAADAELSLMPLAYYIDMTQKGTAKGGGAAGEGD